MQAVIGIAFFVMLGLVRSSTEAFDHEAEQTQGKVPTLPSRADQREVHSAGHDVRRCR